MNLKELVMKHFNLVEAPVEATPDKFGEIKTADGELTIVYDGADLTVGTPVFVRTEDGDIPAPDGEHFLEGDMKIITVGGIVSEILETPAELEEDKEEEMSAETEAIATDEVELSTEEATDEAFEDKREDIIESIAEVLVPMIEEMKKDIEEMKSKFSAMDKKVETIGLEPAATRAKEEIYAKRNPQKSTQDFRNDEHRKVFERIMKRKNK